jgi:hypothetical protein
MTLEVSDVAARRLEALAAAQQKSVEQVAAEWLDTYAASPAVRRAVRKARGRSASLADLGWLEGYSGQTADEILAFESTEQAGVILSTLTGAIEQRIAQQGHGKMTGVERTVLSVMALVDEVNNGGYDQYLRNDSRKFAPAIVDDLERIGAEEAAELTQRALDSLGVESLGLPQLDTAMAVENLERDRALSRCNQKFYELADICPKLLAWVKLHPDGI